LSRRRSDGAERFACGDTTIGGIIGAAAVSAWSEIPLPVGF
jgi:hypothetical protein